MLLVDGDGATGAAGSPTVYWKALPVRVRVERGSKTFALRFSRENVLSRESATAWMDHAWAASPEEAFFRYCRLQNRYIQHLVTGAHLAVEVDEWVNKSSGRGSIRLRWLDEQEKPTDHIEEIVVLGLRAPHEYARRLFPWADIAIDEDYYDAHEDVPPKAVVQDDESPGGHYVVPGDPLSGIRPYADTGEIARYRFRLALNRLGRAYVAFTTRTRRKGELTDVSRGRTDTRIEYRQTSPRLTRVKRLVWGVERVMR